MTSLASNPLQHIQHIQLIQHLCRFEFFLFNMEPGPFFSQGQPPNCRNVEKTKPLSSLPPREEDCLCKRRARKQKQDQQKNIWAHFKAFAIYIYIYREREAIYAYSLSICLPVCVLWGTCLSFLCLVGTRSAERVRLSLW